MAPSRSRSFKDHDGNAHPAFLQECGPIFNVLIHVPTALAEQIASAGGTLPAPQAGMALIDTGATNTCVHEAILQTLGLNPIGSITSGTAAGPVQHNRYPARLEFPGDGIDREFTSVVGVNLTGQFVRLSTGVHPIIALIGRDVLADWVFTYNGVAGEVTISF